MYLRTRTLRLAWVDPFFFLLNMNIVRAMPLGYLGEKRNATDMITQLVRRWPIQLDAVDLFGFVFFPFLFLLVCFLCVCVNGSFVGEEGECFFGLNVLLFSFLFFDSG